MMMRQRCLDCRLILGHSCLFNRVQVGAGDEELSQVLDSVLLFSLELILFLEQLGNNLPLIRCGGCD